MLSQFFGHRAFSQKLWFQRDANLPVWPVTEIVGYREKLPIPPLYRKKAVSYEPMPTKK